MDGERCDMELAPSTPQGVEIFTTSKHQLLVEDSHLPVSRQENKDHLKDFGELLMDRMLSILHKIDKHAQGGEDRMLPILDKNAQGAEDQMSSILDKHLTRLALQPAEQKLQEERDTDEAHVEAYCAKWRDEEEAELQARFDAFEQEFDVAKLAVQLAVQDVSEPALDCVEQKAGQHAVVGQEVKEELQRISVEASVAMVMVSADTVAAFAATIVGGTTSAAAPGEIMDSNVNPWITQFLKQLDAKLVAQLEQLDAIGAARRKQPAQLERMEEQQTEAATRTDTTAVRRRD